MSGFLNRTAQILEFNPLIFFNREGFSVSSHTDNSETPASPEDFLKLPSVRASFQGSIQASYIGGKSIFYSVPVYRDSGVDGVLVGVRSKENMQSLISSKSRELVLQMTRTRRLPCSRTMPGSRCKAAGPIYATAAAFMTKA